MNLIHPPEAYEANRSLRPMKLILDLDNVFIDFVRAIQKLHGDSRPYLDCTCDMAELLYPGHHQLMWSRVTQVWWAQLPWTPEGKEFYRKLLELFDPDDICIATAPPSIAGKYVYSTGYFDGRIWWIEQNMPEIKHISITHSKYFKASPDSLLIDDMDHHCERFLEKGGKTFTPSRPWNRYRDQETFDVTAAINTIRRLVER